MLSSFRVSKLMMVRITRLQSGPNDEMPVTRQLTVTPTERKRNTSVMKLPVNIFPATFLSRNGLVTYGFVPSGRKVRAKCTQWHFALTKTKQVCYDTKLF
jgi:hypothetical protein